LILGALGSEMFLLLDRDVDDNQNGMVVKQQNPQSLGIFPLHENQTYKHVHFRSEGLLSLGVS